MTVYKATFEGLGFRVLTASRGRAGLELAASTKVDAVIVDYEMPEMDGGMVATVLKRRSPTLPIIMFTGSGLIPNRVKRSVDAVCDKARSHGLLLETLRGLLAKRPNRPFYSSPPAPASETQRTVA